MGMGQEIDMDFRRACTAGGMILVTDDGNRRHMPAGICWVGPRDTAAADILVRWSQHGVRYSGRISIEDLTACLSGCLLQYT
jgi:hypothetical protein